MKKKHVRFLLIAFLFLDTAFSFIQHYHKSLDGDLSNIVLGYPEVMSDPLGTNVLLHKQVYGGTNRFFAHWTMSSYFKTVPLGIQTFFTPIESIYLSCALAKTLFQIFIVLLLASFITNSKKITDEKLLIAAVLICPLIQTEGYNNYMGVINPSITYTFFYSLPIVLTMIFFYPTLKSLESGNWQRLKPFTFFFLLVLIPVLALGGPLSPALMIIISSLIILKVFLSKGGNDFSSIKKIPNQYQVLLLLSILASLYSLYIGMYNAENFFNEEPLLKRFELLPVGLYYSFTRKLGSPLLLLAILVNIFVIVKSSTISDKKNILNQSKWILIFCILYLFILPFGGYREYRPNIVRSDTMIPVLICMLYLFGLTSFHIINDIVPKFRRIYIGSLFLLLFIFTIADKSVSNGNKCEMSYLSDISKSQEKIVKLGSDCNVMSWGRMQDPNNSKLNCELLLRWNIINSPKMYYQE